MAVRQKHRINTQEYDSETLGGAPVDWLTLSEYQDVGKELGSISKKPILESTYDYSSQYRRCLCNR